MTNRIDVVGGIWAENAVNVPSGTPTPNVTYANTLMDENAINRAWPFSEIVASNTFNEIMRRMTRLMVQIERQGILSYSVLTDYGIGALVLGSNNILYKALIPNGPASTEGVVDPVDNDAIWKDSGAGGIVSIDATGLATVVGGGPITETGVITVIASSKEQAELGENQTTAMTPLRTRTAILSAPIPTVSTKGVVEKSTSAENVAGITENVYPDVVGVFEMIEEHSVTSVDATGLAFIVGANPITNIGIIEVTKSTETQATEGTNDTTAMTPLRVKNAISSQVDDPLWTESGDDIHRLNGNVGIGVIDPDTKLEIAGQIKITGGIPGTNKILTSDINGLSSWENPAASIYASITNEIADTITNLLFVNDPTGNQELHSNADLTFNSTTGTINSVNLLLDNDAIINGQIKIVGGAPEAGKVLTSDTEGLATWEDPAVGTTVPITNESADTTTNLLFVNDPTGNQELHSNSRLTFNSATETLGSSNLQIINNAVIGNQIQIVGGVPGTDKILTSNSVGLASWEDPIRGIPQNRKSASYTTVLSDNGNHIYHPSTDTINRIWTIDNNAGYPIGAAITFVNDVSSGQITISISSGTLVWAEDGSIGDRKMEDVGVATAIKVAVARWIISGVGIT